MNSKLGSPGMLPQSDKAIRKYIVFSPFRHILTFILRFVASWSQHGSCTSRHHALIPGWRKEGGQRAFSEWGISGPSWQTFHIWWAHLLIPRPIIGGGDVITLPGINQPCFISQGDVEVGAYFLWEQGPSTPAWANQCSVVRTEVRWWLLDDFCHASFLRSSFCLTLVAWSLWIWG